MFSSSMTLTKSYVVQVILISWLKTPCRLINIPIYLGVFLTFQAIFKAPFAKWFVFLPCKIRFVSFGKSHYTSQFIKQREM